MPRSPRCQNLIIISDTHAGSAVSLCPSYVRLDDGGIYRPSAVQKEINRLWGQFWRWTRAVLKDEPYSVLHNGDAIDGTPHGSVAQITNNLSDQAEIAFRMLEPIATASRASGGNYYHIRGTEAHVGKSQQEEERLARRLGAKPNREGQFARPQLWIRVGRGLVHSLHHIGTTGSSAYEATAVYKELVESFVEAGRWGGKAPEAVVRSHRHRFIKTEIAVEGGRAFAIVTPAWQGKTPFVWRIPGGRMSQPQFGGIIIRWSDRDKVLYTRERVWSPAREAEE